MTEDVFLNTTWYTDVDVNRSDAVFYCDGGTSPVGEVKLTYYGQSQKVLIYCDGEMRVRNTKTGTVYRYSSDLIEDGYDTDGKAFSSYADEILEWDNNPWFDLYTEDGDHLDCVAHDLFEAQSFAEQILIEDAGLSLEILR